MLTVLHVDRSLLGCCGQFRRPLSLTDFTTYLPVKAPVTLQIERFALDENPQYACLLHKRVGGSVLRDLKRNYMHPFGSARPVQVQLALLCLQLALLCLQLALLCLVLSARTKRADKKGCN